MANLTQYVIDKDGGKPTFASCAGGGDTCIGGTGSFIIAKNSDASPHDVTLVTPGTSAGHAIADQVVTVAATTGEQWIAVTDEYINPATGRVSLTYSAVTGMTIASVRT
jgi:hypothetical protein